MTPEERFWEKVRKDCWIWTGSLKPSNGYGHLRIANKDFMAHRLAWEFTKGPIPEGMHVLHSCDVPFCVNPDHLFLGTHQENMADMYRKGRHTRGERGKAKLTEVQARAILKEYRKNGPFACSPSNTKELAAKYGVAVNTVMAVVTGRSWRHLHEQSA